MIDLSQPFSSHTTYWEGIQYVFVFASYVAFGFFIFGIFMILLGKIVQKLNDYLDVFDF
jgi:hypothetical protein